MSIRESTILSSSGTPADYFSRAHTPIDQLNLMLAQNAAKLQEKAELPNDFYSFVSNAIDSIMDSTNTTVQNINSPIQQPSRDTFIVLLAQKVLLEHRRDEINALHDQITLDAVAREDLEQKLHDAEAKYTSIIENFGPQSVQQPRDQTKEINDLRKQLSESNERIRLQQQRNSEEIAQLRREIEDERRKASVAEEELEKAQSAAFLAEKEKKEDLSLLAEAFGSDSARDVRSALESFRQRIGVPEKQDGSIVPLIAAKVKEGEKKLNKLLAKFDVKPTDDEMEKSVRRSVEKDHTQRIISLLRTEYEFDDSASDVIEAVRNIFEGGDGLVSELRDELELKGEVNRVNITGLVKDRVEEINALKTENEELKAKIKSDELLLSLIKTKPVVYEVYQQAKEAIEENKDNEEFMTRDINFEEGEAGSVQNEENTNKQNTANDNQSEASEITHIENIAKDLDEAQKTLLEYNTLLENNQKRIEGLERDKEIEVQNAKKEIRQHYRSKIDQLTQVIEALASNEDKLKAQRRKTRQVKAQEEEARRQLSETENRLKSEADIREQLQRQYEETNRQLILTNTENSRLTQELESTRQSLEISQQEDEKKCSNDELLAEVSEQVVSTSQELGKETQLRNALVSLIHRQQQVVVELEQRLAAADVQKEEAITKAREVEAPFVSEINEEALEEALSDINTEAAKDEVKDITFITRSDVDGREKFIRIVQMLLVKVNEVTQQRNTLQETIDNTVDKQPIVDRLLEMMQEQLLFVERIACTKDEAITEDIRENLRENAARVNAFLIENCSGIAEDISLFDALGINADPMQLQTTVDRVLEKCGEFETEEAKEVYIALRQAIAASLVLKKYASEAIKQCEWNANDAAQARNELKLFRQEVERNNKVKEQQEAKKRAKAEEEGHNEEEEENIMQRDISFSEDIEKELEERNAELEECKTVLEETKQKLADRENELQELKEVTTREINEIQDVSGQLEAETTSIIQTQTQELDKLREELHGCRSELNILKSDFEKIQQNNSALKSALQQSKQKVAATEQKMTYEVNRIKDKAAAKLDKAMKMLATEQKQRIDKMSQRLRAVQQELRQRNKEVTEKDEIIRKQEEQTSQLSVNCSQMEEEMQQSVIDNEQRVQSLRREKEEQSEKLQALELDKKVMTNKLKSAEERCEKEKSHYESQLAMFKFAAETRMQEKLEAVEKETEDKEHEFLRDICNTMQEYVDYTVPISRESIISMLENVSQVTKKSQRDAEKANDCERQLNEVRSIIQAQKGTRTTAAVSDFVDTANKQREKLEALEAASKESENNQDKDAKDWEEWGRKILAATGGSTDLSQPSQKVRLALEEKLYASCNQKTLSNKIDILRAQKKLLKSPKKEAVDNSINEEGEGPRTLVPAICAMMFVRRIMKMSNVVPSVFSFKK